jgi:ABC-type transport system involved in cytochrome bd biosynthesis fused ATPase/permease subunit
MAALAVVGAVALAGRFGLPPGGAALVPFAAVFFMSYRPLRDLGDARAWVERGSIALDAVRAAASGGATDVLATNGAGSGGEPALVHAGANRTPEIVLTEFGGAHHGAPGTFRVEPGKIVCVVGPTGAGKTTLIRAMLGLEPARGRLLVDGVDITLAPSGPASRPFAWVPQDAPLVTATTVDNVALVGGRDHAREALRAVGAEDLASIDDIVGPGGRPLSGGERRLLSLARAMSTELPVLLLDEPMEGLDANAAQRVMGAIVRLRGRRSILIVTHRPEVVAIADLVVRLEEGAERRAAAE